MNGEELAKVASLLADRTRAAACIALLDGGAWTAGELARTTGVAPSTMSEHLTRLVDGGLLVERRQGRHRYVSLAGPHVAAPIEQLLALTNPDATPLRSLRAVTTDAALRHGRTCYDHLAGRLGVAIAEAMVHQDLLDEDLALTATGRAWLADALDIRLIGGRRPLARACLDWTERRPHVAGAAGAAIYAELLARRWITKADTSRAVRTTPAGDEALHQLFGIDPHRCGLPSGPAFATEPDR